MKISKTVAAVAGVGLVAAGLLAAAPASADPIGLPAGGDRALAGVGSDTTMNVMNDLGDAITIGGVKQIANWDALPGTTTFQTRTGNAACVYTRTSANGSSAGRSRLDESLTAINVKAGCLDYARSSSGPAATTNRLTYIPFAKDASSYAVRADGNLPRSLTLTQVQNVFKCIFVPDIFPVLPQPGSGSRAFWIAQMGINETQISNGTYPCLLPVGTTSTVGGIAGTGRPNTQENDAVNLRVDEMTSFSIGLYNVQAAGNNADNRGFRTVLGQIDAKLPVFANLNSTVSRDVYNIIPTAKVTDGITDAFDTVFIGTGSLVCANTSIITNNGFSPLTASTTPTCGSTALTS